MDSAESVVEVSEFGGMSFAEILEILVGRCQSEDPRSAAFSKTMEMIQKVHEVAGVPFNRDEYWNISTLTGSHPVYPQEVLDSFRIPTELNLEELTRAQDMLGELENAESSIRTSLDMISSASRRRQNNGYLDPRSLERTVSSAPVHVEVSTADDEDDFL